jgi:hypothetical protein
MSVTLCNARWRKTKNGQSRGKALLARRKSKWVCLVVSQFPIASTGFTLVGWAKPRKRRAHVFSCSSRSPPCIQPTLRRPCSWIFRARGWPASRFSFPLDKRGWSAGRRRGAWPCDRPIRAKIPGPKCAPRGWRVPGRGPLRGARRLPALQRDAIVGHRILLPLRTPRSTAVLERTKQELL